jgi:hypothetical protein
MANKLTVTINTKTAETILKEVESMRQSLEALRKKILKLLPARYGSDEWWEKEIEEGLEEVRRGKVRGPFKNADDLIRSLHQEIGR